MYNMKKTRIGRPIRKKLYNNLLLVYNYNFNPIKNTHLRHVIVHYFSRIVQPEAVFFLTSRRQKPTSYFPYIMFNTKKKNVLDVQYGKNTASGCTIREK
jgi:hypothetical protein